MTTPMGVEGELRPSWPPSEGGCPAWCTDWSMHTPGDHGEDRRHLGPEHQVRLSLEPRVERCNGEWEADYLTVYLGQQQDHDVPRIELGQGDGVTVMLTLQEAMELAYALHSAIVDTAEKS